MAEEHASPDEPVWFLASDLLPLLDELRGHLGATELFYQLIVVNSLVAGSEDFGTGNDVFFNFWFVVLTFHFFDISSKIFAII